MKEFIQKIRKERLISRLEDVRSSLVLALPGFPHQKCVDASYALNMAFGYKICHGTYIFNQLNNNHCWCEDRKGRIIDLTASQYDKSLPDIEILSSDHKRYNRYQLNDLAKLS